MPICEICRRELPAEQLVAAALVRPGVAELIRARHPQWSGVGLICEDDLHRYRWEHVEDLLERDRGELSALEREVLQSLQDQDLVAADPSADFEVGRTVGEKLADSVAHFGGSWRFILVFGVVMCGWVAVNSWAFFGRPFDPFPYILLNLVLSCLAALQAPIIMMSQNRQEAKDRLRSENDYRINLKAELEIRHLHNKIDHVLNQQWQRLMEIQELQLELLQRTPTAARINAARADATSRTESEDR